MARLNGKLSNLDEIAAAPFLAPDETSLINGSELFAKRGSAQV